MHKKIMASIIMATYNRKAFLKRSISSVLAQTYFNWELIIVDDGSTDGSYEYLQAKYAQFNNIKIIKTDNQGVALALNEGVKHAKGKFLFFIGSDDAYEKNHLEFRMRMHQQCREVDIFHGGLKVLGDHWVIDKRNPIKKINIYDCFAGGTFSIKAQVFKKLDGFKNLKFASDSDFIERAWDHFFIQRIDLPTTYLYYRDHPDSITKNTEHTN